MDVFQSELIAFLKNTRAIYILKDITARDLNISINDLVNVVLNVGEKSDAKL